MEYGLIGFKDTEGTNVLDGHALQVLFTGIGAEEPDSKSTDSTVKNVPFVRIVLKLRRRMLTLAGSGCLSVRPKLYKYFLI